MLNVGGRVAVLPLRSSARVSSVCAWGVSPLNGAVYGVHAPPSSRYSRLPGLTPTPQPSSALRVTVGFRYQPSTPAGDSDADVTGPSTSMSFKAAARLGSGPTRRGPVCGVRVRRSRSIICALVYGVCPVALRYD